LNPLVTVPVPPRLLRVEFVDLGTVVDELPTEGRYKYKYISLNLSEDNTLEYVHLHFFVCNFWSVTFKKSFLL